MRSTRQAAVEEQFWGNRLRAAASMADAVGRRRWERGDSIIISMSTV